MKRKVYIYMKEGLIENGPEIETILPYEIIVDSPSKRADSDENLERILNHHITEDILLEKRKEYHKSVGLESFSEKMELLKIEPVFVSYESNYYEGIYYAHEYDEYLPGRIRKIDYNNGYFHYDIECESKEHNVLDGIITEENRHGNRYDNGYGDYFEVTEETPWTAKRKDIC